MQLKKLTFAAALAAGASAQGGGGSADNLTALLTSNDDLSSLFSFLTQYPDIAASLNAAENVTLLAPSNDAIQALTQSGALEQATEDMISAILSYHVLPGIVPSSDISSTPLFAHTTLNDTAYSNVTGGQVVEAYTDGGDVLIVSGLKAESTVTDPDLKYDGGIVHIIDQVLTPPMNLSATILAADLTALAGGLSQTNLMSTLDVAPDVTIFAPSDDAFIAAGSRLGELNVIQLSSVLNYHVINGTTAYSSSLVNGSVETLQGQSVNITVIGGAVFINEARVINADILTSGGVVHIIDSVLNPNNTGVPEPDSNEPAVQFAGASSAAVALTNSVPAPSTTVRALVTTEDAVAAGYTTRTKASGIKKTTTSSALAAVQTGMVNAAALFGGAALIANW